MGLYMDYMCVVHCGSLFGYMVNVRLYISLKQSELCVQTAENFSTFINWGTGSEDSILSLIVYFTEEGSGGGEWV